MKNALYITLFLMFITSCSKDEIGTWQVGPCVWFTKANDTTTFSFFSQPEETTEYVVEIPISMAGTVSESDREVMVKDLGSRNPESRYELSASIPAGEVTGSLRVKVYKTGNLSEARDTIGFEICASEVFEVGLSAYLRNTLIVSNLLAKPAWWNSSALWAVGYYSDKKLEIIYKVLGSDEVFANNPSFYGNDISVAIYKLNQYCKKNNVKYNPDDESVIVFASYSN